MGFFYSLVSLQNRQTSTNMIKVDSDFKYVFWVFACIALAFPLTLFLPLSLPFILGGGLIFYGVKQLLTYKSLLSWEKTDGALIKTEIGLLEEMDNYSKNKYFVPLAYFSYIWNGVEYKSNKYAFDNKSIWSLDSKEVEKTVESLKSLETLEVLVNPKNSNEAVLNTNISKNRYSHAYALSVSGIIVTIIGVVLLIKS